MKIFSKVQSDESEIWSLISGGDEKAFERLFRQYYRPLCSYACTLVKDKDEAEEVVQTVFYNLWKKRESLNIDGAVKPYLYRAAHNDSLNRLKHQKVKRDYAGDYIKTADSNSADASGGLQAKELNHRIHQAIDSLPEQCGQVFRLSRFGHLKYSEIADKLDISVKTVENHMGKALRIMREQLKDYVHLLVLLLLQC